MYIALYFSKVVGNKKEIVRIRQANIAALQDLVKVNPAFQTQLDAAVAEYNQAVADCEAAQAYIAVAQGEFDALQASINEARAAKAVGDADAIK